MTTVFDVAKYILDTIGEISTMKLQKLCYYSQAWHLVWEPKPLFNEDFYHWENGPVCRELFNLHQGSFYVSTDIIPENLSRGELSASQKTVVDKVLEYYGKYDGAQLSELTHKEDPWAKTQSNCVIQKDCIKKYYTSLGK